jgi:hypothetical protein
VNGERKKGRREREKRGGMKKRCYQNTFVYERAKVNENALVMCGLLE